MNELVSTSPFELAARVDLLNRLERVRGMIWDDAAAHASACRELLEDITQRLAARELTRELERVRDDAGSEHACQLRRSVLGSGGGEPVSEFRLIAFGLVQVDRPLAGGDFEFKRRHAVSAKRWFDQMGRKLAIDYEHQSLDRRAARADGLRPAAGWIGSLELREDGLWATQVEWTERARELLRSGEYRYFSPVIYWTDEDCSDIAALGPVALTNDPAMQGVTPLAAKRRFAAARQDALRGAHAREASDAGGPVADGSTAGASDDADADPAAALAADAEVDAQADAPADLKDAEALHAAQAEVVALRRKLTAQEADTFVERGMRQGKVLESTRMDWREDYLRDAQAAEARLARAPILLPPGRLVRRSGGGAGDTQDVARLRELGFEAEDLAAYARANAAGRVRRFNTV